ncbi:P-loop containing nucleoside triphosphate hydrolase protein [Phycomyces nitens]|nr:P-loop containing nucleoside triphosphate hydrolase protein [Phycomyces nitens]
MATSDYYRLSSSKSQAFQGESTAHIVPLDTNDERSLQETASLSKSFSAQKVEIEQKDSKKKNKDKEPMVGFWAIFRYSTRLDKLMITTAFTCSVMLGAVQPMSFGVLGGFLKKLQIAAENNENILDATVGQILIFAYLGVFITLIAYTANTLWVISGENQARRIRQLYVHAILRQDMTWFDNAGEGSLNTRLTVDTQMIQEGISEKFGLYVTAVSQCFVGFCGAFGLGWRLAIIMLAPMPLIIGVGMISSSLTTKYTLKSQDSYAEAGSIAEQVFSGIRTVYSFSLQGRFSALYNLKLDKAMQIGIKRGYISGVGLGLSMLILYATYSLAFWYGSKLVFDGIMSGAFVLMIFFCMIMGTMSISQIPTSLAAISAARGAAFKIFMTIDRVPVIDSDSTEGSKPQDIRGELEFKNVQFTYPTRPDVPILKNLSLKIRSGQTVAFVGPSGSGKSTSIQLIQRFYDPNYGQILLDGQDIKSYNVLWLRSRIGVVSQEPVLFNMSILQNLLMGSSHDIPKEDVISACKQANCHSFISELPQGYNTLVGEHGGMLSGGQKQRIAIARAIIKNPSILLLDEATSALDTQSERLVQKALDAASVNRTTIIIAHRLSTIRNADLIVVMQQGDIIEHGTHNQLLANGGVYSELVSKQKIEISRAESVTEPEDHDIPEFNNVQIHDRDIKTSVKRSQSMRLSRFSTTASVDAFEMKRLQEKGSKKASRQKSAPVSRVFHMMRSEWNLLAAGVVGSAIAGAVSPCFALVFSYTISVLIFHGKELALPFQGINLYAFLFLVIGIVSFFGFTAQTVFFEIAGERFTKRFRGELFHTLMRQDIGFYDDPENSLGGLTSRLAVDAKNVNEMVTKSWGDITQIIATAITGLCIAFYQSWLLTLVVLCVAPFIMGSTAYESRINRGFEDKSKKANEQSGEVAGEAIKEIRTVVALNKQSYFEDKYYKATEYPHTLARRKAWTSSIGFGLQQGIVLFTYALAFYTGIRLMSEGKIDFTKMFGTTMTIITTSQVIGRASVFTSTFAKAKHSAIAAFEIMDRVPSIDPELEGIEPSSSQVSGDISFENITFRYPSRPDVSIFNGEFNLNGKASQTIALVGPSGCGKSTTIGMLQRWYDPVSGTVRLDNSNVNKYSVGNLRSHMALVGQEPVLFDMTIGENIRFGVDSKNTVTQDMVEDSCRAANIHKFIVGLPLGYDTRVGDKGSQLSGGQKQRIAIARALIRKPRVLLLDEATSALDSESEKLVQTAIDNILEEGGRTTITIAHRLSTIQKADLICVIKDGHVAEQGTHWELLKLNGVYSSLVHQQTLNAI